MAKITIIKRTTGLILLPEDDEDGELFLVEGAGNGGGEMVGGGEIIKLPLCLN